MELCKMLRWKGFSRDAAELDAFEFVFARNQVQYSCLRTCQPWGPDDELTAPECCNSSRSCYAPSTLVRKPRVS
ncbi:MAG: hypothetical protein ACPG77_01705 [Nannocystaceae bacterium]